MNKNVCAIKSLRADLTCEPFDYSEREGSQPRSLTPCAGALGWCLWINARQGPPELEFMPGQGSRLIWLQLIDNKQVDRIMAGLPCRW